MNGDLINIVRYFQQWFAFCAIKIYHLPLCHTLKIVHIVAIILRRALV